MECFVVVLMVVLAVLRRGGERVRAPAMLVLETALALAAVVAAVLVMQVLAPAVLLALEPHSPAERVAE